jgi:hypothetical protein
MRPTLEAQPKRFLRKRCLQPPGKLCVALQVVEYNTAAIAGSNGASVMCDESERGASESSAKVLELNAPLDSIYD